MNYTRCIITSDNDELINKLKENNPYNAMTVVCEYIINENDKKIIKKYVKKNKLFSDAENFFNSNIDKYFKRRNYLLSVVSEYLISNSKINVDGFIKFRLREYNRCLEKALVKTKEEFYKYTEYLVYIEVLREIIKNQNRMVNTLFIEIAGSEYVIFDENKDSLNEKCASVLKEEFQYEFDYSDEFLLSAVITLAPEKIYVINPDKIINRRLFDTIRNIYRENYFLI